MCHQSEHSQKIVEVVVSWKFGCFGKLLSGAEVVTSAIMINRLCLCLFLGCQRYPIISQFWSSAALLLHGL